MSVPTGAEVERLAVVLAATAGYAFKNLTFDQAQYYRLLANGVLLRYRPGSPPSTRLAANTLSEAVEALRAAAGALDGVDEALVTRLFKVASATETLSRVVGAEIEDDEVVV